MLKEDLSDREVSARTQRLFHESLALILDPMKEAGKSGIEIVGGDGGVRMVYPVLACYVADYPEQCLVTCTKYGTCPKCRVRAGDLAEHLERWEDRTQDFTLHVIQEAHESTQSNHAFRTKCMKEDVSGGVFRPFWEGFPHTDIHLSITPDVLHQLFQGVFKHMVEWVDDFMEPGELDERIHCLPPCYGVRHFKQGWSNLGQISGKERKQMARILLGCMIGKVPLGVIRCYRALLDFIHLAQYPSHDDHTLGYLDAALTAFHVNKGVLLALGTREHLNIPKIHSLTHYVDSIRWFGTTDNYNTEMFERFHIDFCKEAWYTSNGRNEKPQMMVWLSRREKVASFESYLKMTLDTQNEDTEFTHSRFSDHQIILTKQPHRSKQDIGNIMQTHDCSGFERDLQSYLNDQNSKNLSRFHLQNASLPFNVLDVHHNFKFCLETLGNDVDLENEEADSVKAKPKSKGIEARFDTIVVMEKNDCQSTGLIGKVILAVF